MTQHEPTSVVKPSGARDDQALIAERDLWREKARRAMAALNEIGTAVGCSGSKASEVLESVRAAIEAGRAYQVELRSDRHKSAFAKAAKAAGAIEAAVEDLYALSGYQPEGDAVDESALSELIEGLKQSKPWGFGPDESAGATPRPMPRGVAKPTPTPMPALPPESGRGRPAPGRLRFTYADLADYDFQRAHADDLANGRFTIVD